MDKILIVNGPNLKFLGKRNVEIYGNDDMDRALELISTLPNAPELEVFQSNHEGEIIDRLELARQEYLDNTLMGIVLNAGAFTHTSLALADCLAWINIPFVEVHLSNILARASSGGSASDLLRSTSLFANYSIGLIAGFGIESYVLAVQALMGYKAKSNLIL